MRREITIENIRANLIKEYGTKPIRKAKISIAAGILIAILCFATGRLSGTVVGVIFAAIEGTELLKANRIRKKIETDHLIVREGRCIEKKIKSGIGGPKRYFYFTKKSYFIATDQDIRLWEKTHIGDKFYLISFQDSQEIKKVYPQNILKYVNK